MHRFYGEVAATQDIVKCWPQQKTVLKEASA
jgi:hypothetical protein